MQRLPYMRMRFVFFPMACISAACGGRTGISDIDETSPTEGLRDADWWGDGSTSDARSRGPLLPDASYQDAAVDPQQSEDAGLVDARMTDARVTDARAIDASSECSFPLRACGGTCVDPRWDPLHCGTCGNACGSSEHCASGTCVIECGLQQVWCPGPSGSKQCVSVSTDPQHCGACEKQCPMGATCEQGDCLCNGKPCCEAPSVWCSSASATGCANLDTDPNHCGSCGNACGAGQVCVRGACEGCSPLQFLVPVAYSTGNLGGDAVAPIVDDLDQDGDLDLIVPNSGGASLSLFRGDGTGKLVEQPRLDTAANPTRVRAYDFTGDGFKDLVVLGGGYLQKYRSAAKSRGWLDSPNAGRAFETAQQLALGDPEQGSATYRLELANVTDTDAPEAIVLALGSPTTVTAWNFTRYDWWSTAQTLFEGTFTSETPTQFQAVDVNGDGLLDFALYDRAVHVLFQNGDGTFRLEENWAPSFSRYGAARGLLDLNNDGYLDVVSSQAEGQGTLLYGYSARVALGSPDGGVNLLPDPDQFVTGAQMPNFAFADLNGDGFVDLVTREDEANFTESFLGNGTGDFSTAIGSEIAAGIAGMALADLDRDGTPDLIAAHEASQSLTVHRGRGNGTFDSYLLHLPDKTYLRGAVTLPSRNADSPRVAVVGGSDDGRFRVLSIGDSPTPAVLQDTSVYRPESLALGDLDGDGLTDVVVPAERALYWLRNIGDDKFDDPQLIESGAQGHRAQMGDFDGDGQDEVVTFVTGLPGYTIRLFKRDSALGSWTRTDYPFSHTIDVTIGDLDGDNLDDMIVIDTEFTSSDRRLEIWRGSRTVPLSLSSTVTLPDRADLVQLADLDGDGRNDLYVSLASGYVAYRGEAGGSVRIMAKGSEPVNFAPTWGQPDSSLFDDVDGDGTIDLLVTVSEGTLALWHGLGNGEFTRTETYLVPGGNRPITLADFDGDGLRDLLLSGGSEYGGSLLLLRGAVRCR